MVIKMYEYQYTNKCTESQHEGRFRMKVVMVTYGQVSECLAQRLVEFEGHGQK